MNGWRPRYGGIMAAPANRIEVIRGPDGDLVRVNGVTLPGASMMFRDDRRVVVSIPAAEVTVTMEGGPNVRRIALGEEEL